jgi:hypothetical protein
MFFFHPKDHFQPLFYTKHIENIIVTLLNQSMTLKYAKTNTSKPKIKNLLYLFFRHFQSKKKHIAHPFIIWKQFVIKIDRFYGQNHHQQQLSLSMLESGRSFSLLPPKKIKK